MLFDLRGRGRRRTIKVIYVALAVLMGGGLVLFGIGGAVSGGLVDAISEGGGGGNNDKRLQQRADSFETRTRANPGDARAWAELARARFLVAGQGGNQDDATGGYTAAGKKELRRVAQAWERHLALAGERPDDSVAALMVQAFSPGALDRPADAVRAQEVVTEARPSPGTFVILAEVAYAAGQTRKGDLAAERTLELAERDQRATLKARLDEAKQQAGAASVPPASS